MTMDERADILKVAVMRMAMAAPAPKPGSTPTSVPKRTPTKQLRRLEGTRKAENPNTSWSKAFNVIPLHSQSTYTEIT
jgi:hypothetical protein